MYLYSGWLSGTRIIYVFIFINDEMIPEKVLYLYLLVVD